MLLSDIRNKVLVFDGAMGTALQDAGLKAGDIPEELNIDKPELVQSIHQSYLDAGCNIISTNTFGCNSYKMKDSKYTFEEMIKAAIDNAKKAITKSNKDAYIAYDIGPIGCLLEPMGTLSFDEAYEIIKQQVDIVKNEVDVICFETMSDIYELKAGVLACKENCNLPVFVSMTFEQNHRTLSGCDPITYANIMQGLKVDALGVNCSLGPVELKPIVNKLLNCTNLPIIVQPNAGMPKLVDGNTIYDIKVDEYVSAMLELVNNGVSIVGGCCGTTPQFIKELVQVIPNTYKRKHIEHKTIVSSATCSVEIDDTITVCGERLNPTGKKKIKEALLSSNYDVLIVEAINQQQASAKILDVNVGLPGIDEPKVIVEVIKQLQEVISIPLQIDSSDPKAIELACRYYNGKPLINSINGKQEVLDEILPIVAKYGAVVVALTLDNDIPMLCEQRVNIAKNIINEASIYNINKKDIIVDCLTLTASAQQKEVIETLKAISMIKSLGLRTTLGVSNVSFGLPNRALLNKTFLTMAMYAGLNMPIINPLDKEMMDAIDAYNVLANNDLDSLKYIDTHSNVKTTIVKSNDFSLNDIIILGLKDEVVKKTQELLITNTALSIVNDIIIPSLDIVGNAYEKNEIFLPQLIQSAETCKLAFQEIKKCFSSENTSKGPLLMATVEGDIHDIGKNIVKVVLESYGFNVIDLGKSVSFEKIYEAYLKYKPKGIGLSALMTTTVISMENTIRKLKEKNIDCPIFVGGAVLSKDIAKNIKADYYTKDAMECVNLLNNLIE